MPNIHGLHSLRANNNRDHNDDSSDEEGNDRYVGGVDSRGGGSGLAVLPSRDDQNRNNNNASSDAIFNLAEADTGGASGGGGTSRGSGSGGGGGGGGVHRTVITMYRSGFTVDDGPYRRLDDPANSEFLTSMARGHVPRELRELAMQNHGDGNNDEGEPEVMVGLVDRRGEEYDPEKLAAGASGGGGVNRRGSSDESAGFQSFSGEGQSLGGASSATGGGAAAASGGRGGGAAGGIIHPSSSSTPVPLDPNIPSTSIAIRLLNGSRLVIKVNTCVPVSEIGHHIGTQAGESSYVLTSGYPPRIVEDLSMSIEEAGLMGSQVVLKAV